MIIENLVIIVMIIVLIAFIRELGQPNLFIGTKETMFTIKIVIINPIGFVLIKIIVINIIIINLVEVIMDIMKFIF